MQRLIKGKTVTVIGLLCAGLGVVILLCGFFNVHAFQAVSSLYLSIKVGPALFLIVAGGVLLLLQYQAIKNFREAGSKEGEAEKSIELRALTERLKNCKGNYETLIEQSFDAIYVLDYEGNFIDANTRLCKMTGYTRDELLKRNITDLIDPQQLKTDPFIPYNNKYDEGLLKERRLIRKNGEVFDVEINAKKLTENRLLVIAEDVTRRKELEIDLHQAELKFRTLAEKSSAAVYVIQQEKLAYINPRFAEIFGYEVYELVNLPTSFIDMIIGEECRALVRKNLWDRYRGDIDYANYEVTGIKKDGALNHVEFSGSRAVIDGEPTIIGTMIDVTARWEAEEALKQSEASLQTILDTADIAYALFDKELKATAFNELASKFTMSQYGHMLKTGESLTNYFPAGLMLQFTGAINEVLKGSSINHEISFQQPDGSEQWYLVRLFPIANEHKEVQGLMLALSNITDRKAAEQNLHTAYQRIQKHISSIKDMAWKQSHLVRSPLANLKGLVALLQDDPSDTEVLKKIGVELDRLDKIIIEMAEDASNHD